MRIVLIVLAYIGLAIVGYLIGSLHPAYLIGRSKGIDVRDHGSGNSGASNATITMGWKVGVLVGGLDILKGFIPVYVMLQCVRYIPVFSNIELAPAVIGFGCVIGHLYPYLMHFRGGKGFATYLGMATALCPQFFVCIGIAIIIITVVSDYIVLATLTTIISFPVIIFLLTFNALIALIVLAASVLIFLKHIPNLKRIADGTEIGLRSSGKHRVTPEQKE